MPNQLIAGSLREAADLLEQQQANPTETRGALGGKRVVRGREAECRACDEAQGSRRVSASAR